MHVQDGIIPLPMDFIRNYASELCERGRLLFLWNHCHVPGFPQLSEAMKQKGDKRKLTHKENRSRSEGREQLQDFRRDTVGSKGFHYSSASAMPPSQFGRNPPRWKAGSSIISQLFILQATPPSVDPVEMFRKCTRAAATKLGRREGRLFCVKDSRMCGLGRKKASQSVRC